jgi:hypothetical protein
MAVFDETGTVVGPPEVVDCQQLFDRLRAVRSLIREEIAVGVLMAVPTKAADRLVAGLLDSLNGLEALLRVEIGPNERSK